MKVALSLSAPSSLLARLQAIAKDRNMKTTALIVFILRNYVQQEDDRLEMPYSAYEE